MRLPSFLKNLITIAVIVITLQTFPIVFDVIIKGSTVFSLIAIFCTVKNFLRKYFFGGRICSRNKAVLITGCDTGFGHLLAQRLDRLGFHVFAACLFPTGDGAQDLKSRTSPNLQIFGLDVSNKEDVLKALEFVKMNLSEKEVLWAVVNNAGIIQCGEFEWTSIEKIRRIFDVNTFGLMQVTQVFLPLLRKSKGRVVNAASISGRMCVPGLIGYSMSKGAVVSFTCGLRMEMAKFGVKVISIEPFFYKTAMADVNRHEQEIENAFDECPEDVKDAYGRLYLRDFKQLCLENHRRCSENLAEVTDCFEDAIMAEEPQLDYFPCTFAHKIVAQFLGLFPLPVIEEFLKRNTPRLKIFA